MSLGLKRYHGVHDLHFITFSCYQRLPFLATWRARDVFLRLLEQVRRRYRFTVAGEVVTPEHVHLLVSEPERKSLSVVLQVLKRSAARKRGTGRGAHISDGMKGWPTRPNHRHRGNYDEEVLPHNLAGQFACPSRSRRRPVFQQLGEST